MQSPLLSKQALKLTLKRKAFSEEMLSTLYLDKHTQGIHINELNSKKSTFSKMKYSTDLFVFFHTWISIDSTYSIEKTFCIVSLCHLENSNCVRSIVTFNFSIPINTFPLHLSTSISVCTDVFSRFTSVQHFTPEHDFDIVQTV